MSTFDFTIFDIAELLGITNIRYTNAAGDKDVDCPFCGKKGKLNLNKKKNCFRCNSCAVQGGMLSLYTLYNGMSDDRYGRAKAVSVINEALYGEDKEKQVAAKRAANERRVTTAKTATEEPRRASRETIHQTYSMLLASLSLGEVHQQQLQSRGLKKEDMDRFNYKSVPAYGLKKLCKELLDVGCVLEGVPGFYIDKQGKWTVRLDSAGLIIPVCGIDRKIDALLIRQDKPFNDRKYIWLTSNGLPKGVKLKAPLHFVGDPEAKKVFITEGALKGTVAHSITGYTFICVPGVNNLNGLDEWLKFLKKTGTEIIVEAYDMDKFSPCEKCQKAECTYDENKKECNKHSHRTYLNVSAAQRKLRELIEANGYVCNSARWKNQDLKGIDDYYLYRWKQSQEGGVRKVSLAAPV